MSSRSEVLLYTTEQVANHLLDAAELVDGLSLPEHFRVTAFDHAVRMLSQKHVAITAPAPPILAGGGLLGGGRVQ